MDERLIAIVATPAGVRLSSDNIVRALGAFISPSDSTPHVARTDSMHPNSFVIRLAGVSVAALPYSSRIPDETLASALQNELLWRGAADTFRAASEHVFFAVVSPSHDPQQSMQQARVLTFITAAALTAMSGKGVFWLAADTVIEPERFRQEALDLCGSQHASPLWFSFRFFPGSENRNDPSLVCQSTGLEVFLGRELECGPYHMPPAEIAPIVLFVARYMATSGPVFGDGHTLGSGEDSTAKDARLTFASSRRSGVECPVFRLTLAAQEEQARRPAIVH
jgi:uncharacterized protein DUF4261